VVDTVALFVRGDTVPLSIIGGNDIYQNARGNETRRTRFDLRGHPQVSCLVGVR